MRLWLGGGFNERKGLHCLTLQIEINFYTYEYLLRHNSHIENNKQIAVKDFIKTLTMHIVNVFNANDAYIGYIFKNLLRGQHRDKFCNF